MSAPARTPATNTTSRRKTSAGDSYTAMGIILIAIAAALIYGSSFGSKAISNKVEELKQLDFVHKQAETTQLSNTRKIKTLEQQLGDVARRSASWRESDRSISIPWSINVADILSSRARQKQPKIFWDGSNSEPQSDIRRGMVEMKVYGDFTTILAWLIQAEHDLDMIRVTGARWAPREGETVNMTLNLEVDFEPHNTGAN